MAEEKRMRCYKDEVRAPLLVGIGLVACACTFLRPLDYLKGDKPNATADDGGGGPGSSDGGASDGPSGLCDPGTSFGPAEPVPGVNTGSYQGSATLSGDEREIYFDDYDPSRTVDTQLWVARRNHTDEPFGARKQVPVDVPTAGSYGGALSVDGQTLIFASARPTLSLYRSMRSSTQDDFSGGTPIHGLGIVAESGFLTPTLALWITSRVTGKLDFYYAEPSGADYTAAVPVTELNTPATETGPVPTSDGLAIYFGSSRNQADGVRLDIFLARRATPTGRFGDIVRVADLDTPDDEWPSWLSPDGCRLYFTSNRNGGNYDLYFARRRP